MTTPVGLESTLKFTMTGGYFMQLYTEPLLLHNGGTLHNSWPQSTFNHTIHEKPHNLWRTAQFSQNKPKCTQSKKKRNLIYSYESFLRWFTFGNPQTLWIFALVNNQHLRLWYPFFHPQGLPIGTTQANPLLQVPESELLIHINTNEIAQYAKFFLQCSFCMTWSPVTL